MKNIFVILRSPMLIGMLLVMPFVILELINRHGFNEKFPVPLFSLLWLLPTIFLAILLSMIRNVRAGNRLMMYPFSLFFKLIFLILAAWLWVSVLADQLPCFMGVPNCD